MIDYHLHSTYSIDGRSPLRSYVEKAETLQLEEIGFSEHVDVDTDEESWRDIDPRYFSEVKELRSHTPVLIKCGLEVSYQHYREDEIKDYLSGVECDFVIGSVHDLDGILMDSTFFEKFSPRQYFEEVETMVKSGLFDIVGHLEYFKRWGGVYSSASWEGEISRVLQHMIEKDVVLEVNTSGLRHPACDTYPSPQVIHLYKTLGGELLSLGSDAHDAQNVGFEFPRVRAQLISEGFDSAASFSERSLVLQQL